MNFEVELNPVHALDGHSLRLSARSTAPCAMPKRAENPGPTSRAPQLHREPACDRVQWLRHSSCQNASPRPGRTFRTLSRNPCPAATPPPTHPTNIRSPSDLSESLDSAARHPDGIAL